MDVRFSDLNFKSPTLACDGHMVMVNNQDGSTNILFFQTRNAPNESFRADVVAGIRLSFQQLEELSRVLSQSVDNYKKKEK